MKIVVVGSTSAVAKVLIPRLAVEAQVITAGRSSGDLFVNLEDFSNTPKFPDNLDVVIHLAAHFGGNSPEDVRASEAINVMGTLSMCHASALAGVRHFILVSSIYSQMDPTSTYYSAYAMSKKHAEEAARFFCSACSLPLTILRPAQLYGNSNDFTKHQPFLYAMAKKAQLGEDIALFGKNDALRNFLHVDDLANIILRVIQRRVTGTYSCQYPENVSISQIAAAANSAFESQGSIHFVENNENIRDNVFAIDHSLYQQIAFYPEVSILEGMRRIASNERK